MTNYRLEMWIDKMLPKGKKEFSRDAVEILLSLLWDEARKSVRSDDQAEKDSEYDV